MSKQKTNSGLLSSGAITEEAMLAYLRGEFSAEDKTKFEELLATDPFAQDALEGLQGVSQPSLVQPTLIALQNKVRERSGLKEAKTIKLHWATYAWAAAVIGLLMGVGVLLINMLNTKDATLAENQETVPTETSLFEAQESEAKLEQGPLPDAESGTIADEKPKTIVAEPLTTTTDVVQNKKPELREDQNATAGAAMSAPVAINTTAAPAKPAIGDDKLREEEKVPSTSLRSAEALDVVSKKEATSKMNTEAMAVAPDKNKKMVTVDDAMKDFNSGNYQKASEQFDAVLKSQPDNAEALYFGGISDYINGNTKKSEKNFDKLLADSRGYVEGSKWYKANILLKKGKKEEAKKLLQDLSQTNGSYKERAVKKLAEIQ